MYFIMGACEYGEFGPNPVVSSRMWETFAPPRMLHDIEVVRTSPAMIYKIDNFQRSTVIRLQPSHRVQLPLAFGNTTNRTGTRLT